MLPPPALILQPKSMKIDPFLEKLLKQKPMEEGIINIDDEIRKKIIAIEEKEKDSFKEADGVGIKKEIDYTNQTQCPRCEQWMLKELFHSHQLSHSSQILDFLFLGGERNAFNLTELTVRTNIKAIVNCSQETQNYFPELFEYKQIEVYDEPDTDLFSLFEECANYIYDRKLEGKNVLVHCIQGISRSTSIVLGYLMLKENFKLNDAFKLVKGKRSIARPNTGFCDQLLKLEKNLYGENTITQEELRIDIY